jgi:hypothetical protein
MSKSRKHTSPSSSSDVKKKKKASHIEEEENLIRSLHSTPSAYKGHIVSPGSTLLPRLINNFIL